MNLMRQGARGAEGGDELGSRNINFLRHLLSTNHAHKLDQAELKEIALILGQFASSLGPETSARVLVDKNVVMNIRDNKGNTPLHYAAENGNTDLVNMLVYCGSPVDIKNCQGNTPLMLAVDKIHEDIVTSLVAAGASVNVVDTSCDSPLIVACRKGKLSLAKCLINAGAFVNYAGSAGDTALIHASRFGHKEIVKTLLDNEAAINAHNMHGHTALISASNYSRTDTVRCLLQHGADVNCRSKTQDTALIYASGRNKIKICKDLLKAGADVNAVNENGNNALISAARNSHAEILRLLIESGSRKNHMNNQKQTALWFAVCQSVLSLNPCLMLLLESGVEISFELHCAVSLGLREVVQEMLYHGASPRLLDTAKLNLRSPPPLKSLSPLCVALVTQRMDIVTCLMDGSFLTDYDILTLPGDIQLRQYLQDNGKMEALSWLDNLQCRPWALVSLSLFAVSKAVGFGKGTREERVKGTGLPTVFQRELLFSSNVMCNSN